MLQQLNVLFKTADKDQAITSTLAVLGGGLNTVIRTIPSTLAVVLILTPPYP